MHTLDQYKTADNKTMWILDTDARSLLTNLIEQMIGLINTNIEIARKLNHHDFNILNVNKRLNPDGSIHPEQTLYWAIMPILSGGLEEDLNTKQLSKFNKALVKFDDNCFKIKFKVKDQLTKGSMFRRMEYLRYKRKNAHNEMTSNHFYNLFK